MDSSYVLCFYCANIYKYKEGLYLSCPKCRGTMDQSKYNKLIDYSSDAIEFGYFYRNIYEDDLSRDGELNSRYALAPLEHVFAFIALAALSGVIGNVSYDIVKQVFNTIRKQRTIIPEPDIKKVDRILDNVDEVSKLLMYLDDFSKDFPSINPIVKKAITEEMIVHNLTKCWGDGSEIDEAIIKTRLHYRIRRDLNDKDFAGLWTEIKNSNYLPESDE